MPRHSFVQIQKITNVKGRIDYISSHARQENLYAVYDTAPQKFWNVLAKESQREFQKSGTEGTCIEARELIIALPESYVNFEPDWVLKTFTDSFKEAHGVECVAALHHNKKKTNYHIHLIFSERTMLEEPDIKIASRNMFYDEQGKHVRTKKELLDEQGNMRNGCTVIAKGEVYEKRSFSNKISLFKSDVFLENEKKRLTELMNCYIKNPLEQLQVFDKSGVYLPTKKIGKNNPKAAEIMSDNQARKEWNQAVDIALVEGVPETDIQKIKNTEIAKKVGRSIAVNGRSPGLFLQIIVRARVILMNLVSKQKLPPKPKISVDITEYHKMQKIKQDLDKQVRVIRQIEEKELPDLLQQSDNLKGIFKSKERKEVERQIETAQNRVSDLKSYLVKAVTRYGYKNIQSFIKVYSQSEKAVQQYQKELEAWKEDNGLKPPKPESIRDKLRQYEREAKVKNLAVLDLPRQEKEKHRNER